MILCARTERGTGKRIIRYTMYKYEKYDKFRRQAGKDLEVEWNRAHPQDPIEVRYEPIGSQYTRKLNAEVVADTLHDVFFVPTAAYHEFIRKGILLPLDPLIEAHGDWDKIREIHPALLEDSRYEGMLYSLPNNCGLDVLYYNRRLFDQAGAACPDENWTWERLREAAIALTRRDASGRAIQFGLVFPKELMSLLIWKGCRIFEDDFKTPALCSPEDVEALQFFHRLIWKDRTSPTPSEESGEAGTECFINNHAALFLGRRWQTALFRSVTDLDWAVAPLPMNPDGRRHSLIGFNYLGISARTRHPDVAYQLLMHLISPEQIRRIVEVGDSIPIRGGKEFEEFLNEPGRPKGENRAYQLALEDSKGLNLRRTPYLQEALVSRELNRAAERAFMSPDADVAAIMRRASETITQLMAEEQRPYDKPNLPFFALGAAAAAGVPLFLTYRYLRGRFRRDAPALGGSADPRKSAAGYLFILPNVAGFLLFTSIPVVMSFLLAFTDWDLLSWPPRFIGFAGFIDMLERREFWKYCWNTLFLMTGIPIGIAGSLLLAVVLNQKMRGRMFFRSVFFLPSFTAGVAIFMLWRWIYNPEFGILNMMLAPVLANVNRFILATPEGLWAALGAVFWAAALADTVRYAIRTAQTWLDRDIDALNRVLAFFGNTLAALVLYFVGWTLMNIHGAAESGLAPPKWLSAIHSISLGPLFLNAAYRFDWAKPAFILVGVWSGVGGFHMILYLAGLQNINPELYEAAAIDGASRWQRFKSITWPLLSPTTFFIFIMSVIGGFQGGFEAAYVMTQGGPDGATNTLGYYIYENAFEYYKMGYAAALSWFLFLVVFVVTLANWRFGGSHVTYD